MVISISGSHLPFTKLFVSTIPLWTLGLGLCSSLYCLLHLATCCQWRVLEGLQGGRRRTHCFLRLAVPMTTIPAMPFHSTSCSLLQPSVVFICLFVFSPQQTQNQLSSTLTSEVWVPASEGPFSRLPGSQNPTSPLCSLSHGDGNCFLQFLSVSSVPPFRVLVLWYPFNQFLVFNSAS